MLFSVISAGIGFSCQISRMKVKLVNNAENILLTH